MQCIWFVLAETTGDFVGVDTDIVVTSAVSSHADAPVL
jgi:hypothetical protein